MDSTAAILAYLAPEPYLPLASVIALVGGFFLMLGPKSLRALARVVRLACGPADSNQSQSGNGSHAPHHER